MNRDTAITQAQLNMTNQVTPYGNLTYTQTGSAFAPSDTGQTYYYNSKTGEYSQTGPKITGYTTAAQQAPRSLGNLTLLSDSTKTNAGRQPIYEDGWTQVKGNLTPQYTATTTLSPEQQAILDQTNGASLNLATIANDRSNFLRDYLGREIDLSGAPALQSGYDLSKAPALQSGFNTDFSADRQKVEDALMQRQQASLDANRDKLNTQLIASGIRPGTAAYAAQMESLGKTENDARLANILAAGQEQTRLSELSQAQAAFNNAARLQYTNEAQSQAAFGNSARSQYLNEAYARRNQPLAEISALLSGSQIQNPNFVNTPQTQVGGVDYTGLVSDNYKSQLAASQSKMGGIFGLLSGGIGLLSDRRAKTDIQRVGTLDNGLPVYSYRYKGGSDFQIGLMADEVEQINPHAVNVGSDGLSRVRYDLAVESN
jgi:hypothetical protein